MPSVARARQDRAGRRALLVYNLAISAGLLLLLVAVVIEAVAGWRATHILPTVAIAVGSVLVWHPERPDHGVRIQPESAVCTAPKAG